MPCVSTKTSEDAQRLLSLSPSQTPVILNSCFQSLAGQASESDPPYIHNVAHSQPYKNRLGALRIGERLLCKPGFESFRLKLAGGEPAPELADGIASSPARDRIDVVAHPSGDELRSLVLGSSLLLFPSWDEGFGLPILEAQTAGICPAASNRAPMTEVGGDACLYFDPSDPEAAADAIAQEWASRGEIIAKGPANLARFAPQAEGDALATLYRQAAGAAQ
jgi:glycosyltransferase involved in cell wall biosynthesis